MLLIIYMGILGMSVHMQESWGYMYTCGYVLDTWELEL